MFGKKANLCVQFAWEYQIDGENAMKFGIQFQKSKETFQRHVYALRNRS